MRIRKTDHGKNSRSYPNTDPSTSGNAQTAGGGSVPRPVHRTWEDIQGRHWRAGGITRLERARAWIHGRRDGKRGLVRVEADGLVVGPYCTQIVQLANQSLSVEWKICCCDMKEFVPFLEQQQHLFDGLCAEIDSVALARRKATDYAHEIHYSADRDASTPTLERRMKFRETRATKDLDEHRGSLTSNMEVMRSAGYEALADYYAREEISLHNEECIRFECIQKVAIYVRAALSLRASAAPSSPRGTAGGTLCDAGFGPILAAPNTIGNVAPCELTDEPRTQHFLMFRRYSFDARPAENS